MRAAASAFAASASGRCMWEAETSSYDMNRRINRGDQLAGKTRMYPHVFQTLPGDPARPRRRRGTSITGFECLDFRWRDPNEGADDVGDTRPECRGARSIVTAPAGAGRPASTTNAMQVNFDFESCRDTALLLPASRSSRTATATSTRLDMNAAPAVFDANTPSMRLHLYACFLRQRNHQDGGSRTPRIDSSRCPMRSR
jgi:hypothetical protein